MCERLFTRASSTPLHIWDAQTFRSETHSACSLFGGAGIVSSMRRIASAASAPARSAGGGCV
eukprot:4099130-Pyramimonas_sp.AAC.1